MLAREHLQARICAEWCTHKSLSNLIISILEIYFSETLEPEMGFLTDHNYHYPPHALLNDTVGQIWRDKPPVSDNYSFVEEENPDYVLVGEFAKWTNMYRTDMFERFYRHLVTIGSYDLYEAKKISTQELSTRK